MLQLQLEDEMWLPDEPADGGAHERRWRRRCCALLPAVLTAAALAAAFELRLLHGKQVGSCMSTSLVTSCL